MKAKNNNSNSSLIAISIMIALLLLASWGMNNVKVALFLIEHPIVILPYIVDKVGYSRLIPGGLFVILILLLVFIRPDSKLNNHNRNVIRGAKIIPARQLKVMLKKKPKIKNQPQLKIGGIPIPAEYENLGFITFGSPGTGKTQLISQTIATIRERSDFRAIVFDRSGEMLEKFYDPTKDIIFNPFDARSVAWSHAYEAARPETMAAALIPQESEKEPFFSNAGRVVMAELFRQTKNNQELWELLRNEDFIIYQG